VPSEIVRLIYDLFNAGAVAFINDQVAGFIQRAHNHCVRDTKSEAWGSRATDYMVERRRDELYVAELMALTSLVAVLGTIGFSIMLSRLLPQPANSLARGHRPWPHVGRPLPSAPRALCR
jgi:hypothetical protein